MVRSVLKLTPADFLAIQKSLPKTSRKQKSRKQISSLVQPSAPF